MSKNINFMIKPRDLNQIINIKNDIILIDVRSKEEYKQGHLPNAINIPEIFTYLPEGLTSKEEKDSFSLFFQNVFSKAGISQKETVVFYEEKFTLKAPRGLAILKYMGHDEEKIKVLDGGYHLWEKNKFRIDKNIVKNPEKQFIPKIQESFFVDYNEMIEILDDDKIIKLDVRDKDEWIGISSSPYGIDYAPKKGRLPNALWIEWYEFITNDMLSVKNLERIQKELDKKDVKVEDNIVLYCFKGARLSNSYIALRKLGYENIRIYFAGWNEWCRKSNAPIINEVENDNNPLLRENIALKKKIDELQQEKLNLINFQKYNKEPIFAFDREGKICSENEAKRIQIPNLNSMNDLFFDLTKTDIFNMIDNNNKKNITYCENNSYFNLRLIGSQEENRILVFGFDVTEIYNLNNSLDEKITQLKQSKETFDLLFDTAPIFLNSIKDGKFDLWNKECEKIFGWSKKELDKKENPIELFYPDVNSQKEVINTINNKPQKVFRQWKPLNKKGEILTTMWAHVYLSNGQIINIGYDITKIKSDEKKYLEQSKLAAMGEMIGNIAHQWRQPLSVISTATSGMKIHKEYDLLSDEQFHSACDAIEVNVKYLSKTIDDFRNFIKGDSEILRFNLKDEIDSFLKLVQPDLKSYYITPVLLIDKSLSILGYPSELKQCFINLFNNSKDALIQNKEIEDAYIFIDSKIFENKIQIIFKDNAGGIDNEIISKIFEPYFTTKHQSRGTGLGLHMTYNLIVEGMKGTIEVDNTTFWYKNNKYTGAEFIVTLPLP